MTENEQRPEQEQPAKVKKNKPKWFVGLSAIVLLGLGVGSYNYLMAGSTTQKTSMEEPTTKNLRVKNQKNMIHSKKYLQK